MNDVDERLFMWMNATGASPEWLLKLAAFAADYVCLLVPLVLTAMWLRGRNREAAFRALLATLVALALGQCISLAYFHPRPFMVPIGHTFASHAADASFPSDHGIVFFTASLALLLCRQWMLGWMLMAAGLLVAWSRIYLGIHFPFDMAGALLTAAAACAITWRGWRPLGEPLLKLSLSLYRKTLALATPHQG